MQIALKATALCAFCTLNNARSEVLKPSARSALLHPNLSEIPLDMVGDKAFARFEATLPSMLVLPICPGKRAMAQPWLRGTAQSLIRLNMKTTGKKAPPALAKGQLWKTKDRHIRIVELGKMLVHYKMLKDAHQMRSTQMSRVDNMLAYLKTNRAQLVENTAVAA